MTDRGAEFRALHRPGDPFVLANVWDRGTARMLESLGAKALATSSAALAFTLGRPDGGTVTRDESLTHAEDLVAAVGVPVQGDFENGFGADPETCAETVRLAAEAGLAGICLEDTDLPGTAPYDFDLSVERIRAAAAAARALPRDFVLTARADGVMLGSYSFDEALRRARAFEAAGADCLYVPHPGTIAELERLCAALAAPVNVLMAGPWTRYGREDLAPTGVARISLGSSLARVTQQVLLDAGREILGEGGFGCLAQAAQGSEIDALLKRD